MGSAKCWALRLEMKETPAMSPFTEHTSRNPSPSSPNHRETDLLRQNSDVCTVWMPPRGVPSAIVAIKHLNVLYMDVANCFTPKHVLFIVPVA